MEIKKIFVVGAGQMGSGIAQAALQAGYDVTLQDTADGATQRASLRIHKSLQKLVEKEKIEAVAADHMLKKFHIVSSLEDAADADLVIEAAIEDMEVKGAIFKVLDEVTREGTILASNTSSISITEIAATTKRPEKVIGMHFFNPPAVMKLLEITKGYLTEEETINQALEVGKKMGKETIVALDKPGFIVNRMIDIMLNEAICLVEEGVGTPEDIDKGMKFGCNHPMGPLELIDLIGLDVLLAVMEVFYEEYGDPKYRPAPLLRKMVRAGRLGRKSGEGFYKY